MGLRQALRWYGVGESNLGGLMVGLGWFRDALVLVQCKFRVGLGLASGGFRAGVGIDYWFRDWPVLV